MANKKIEHTTLKEYLLSRVRKADNGCWLWQKHGADSEHYGSVNNKLAKPFGKTLTHQLSYLVHIGAIPEGLVVRHKCVSKGCLNPDHLELGSQADNVQDRIRDNTVPKGSKAGSSKLTEDQVAEMRQDRVSGMSVKDLATKYNVKERCVYQVTRYETWKHV